MQICADFSIQEWEKTENTALLWTSFHIIGIKREPNLSSATTQHLARHASAPADLLRKRVIFKLGSSKSRCHRRCARTIHPNTHLTDEGAVDVHQSAFDELWREIPNGRHRTCK